MAQITLNSTGVASNGALVLQSNGTTAAVTINSSQGVEFNAGSAALPAITTTGDTNTGIFFPAADTIAFSEGGVEAARFDSSGNLLVGTTSSLATLAGATNASGFIYGTTDALVLATNNSNANLIINRTNSNTAGRVLSVRYNGSEVGSISLTASTTAFNTSSDYRLKNTIAPMTGALDKVALLKPVTYKWNVDESDGQGFLAHELQEVCPLAVTGTKDAVNEDGSIKSQGVDYSKIVALLTASIQEQQALITSLTARITALEN